MNNTLVHSRSDSSHSVSSGSTSRKPDTIVSLYSLVRYTCEHLSFEDAFEKLQKGVEPDKYVFVFQMLPELQIADLRRLLGVHPVIDCECSNSVINNKDCFLDFKRYFLFTLSDASHNDNPEQAVSIKLLYLPGLLLIFTTGVVQAIEEVFCKHLNFLYPLRKEVSTSSALHEKYKAEQIHLSELGSKTTSVESVFHQIIEALVRE